MNARYQRGRRAEWRSRDRLRQAGYTVVRAAGSKGVFDLIGWTETETLLVQVKCDRWPSPAELTLLRDVPTPPGWQKMVHRWDRRKPAPQVRVI